MGNCLVVQDRKEIKIMSVDGSEVLKVPCPSRLKVHDDDSLGKLQLPASILPGKAPALAPAVVVYPSSSGAVRVKVVISKQELKKMHDKEGLSLDDFVSLMRKEASCREQECCGVWRPALESIPEGSDL